MSKKKKIQQRGSIKFKLIGIVLPVIIIMITMLIFISYSRSKVIITNNSKSLLSTSTKDQVDQIEAWLKENLAAFQAVKTSLEGANLSKQEKQDVLEQFKGYNSNYPEGMRIADEQGTVLAAKGDSLLGKNVKDSVWFQEGKTRINMNYGSAYQNEEGKNVISASCLLIDGKQGYGVLSADLSLDKISIIVNSKIEMKDAKAFLVDRTNGVILTHRDSSLISTKINESSDAFLKKAADKIEKKKYDSEELEENLVEIQPVSGTNWLLVSYVPTSSIFSDLKNLQSFMIMVSAVSILLLIVMIERVVHIVIKPVKALTNVIVTMGNGDFTVDVKTKGNDEIGTMSKSVEQFIFTMRGMIADIKQVAEKLNEQAEESSQISGELFGSSKNQSKSMEELNRTVDDLTNSINDLAESATTLANVVDNTTEEGTAVNQDMKETVSVTEQGRTDMEQIGSAMDNIKQSIQMLEEAVNKVGEASNEIEGIVGLIRNIAEETNLLSLNASIEAARAGEAGKGFAVVASEIGKLANTSTESVDKISKLIGEITSLISDAIRQANESSSYINESSGMITESFDTFDKIFDTINMTNIRVQKMLDKVKEVDDIATSVAAISEEQAAGSEEILASSEVMVTNCDHVTDNSKKVDDESKQLKETADKLDTYVKRFIVDKEEIKEDD